jgi:hypothetical protein
METLAIAKRAFEIIRTRPGLWFFGFFVAAIGGGTANEHQKASRTGHGESVSLSAADVLERAKHGLSDALEQLPGWIVPIAIAALLFAAAVLVMHIVSEGALIDAVSEGERGRARALKHAFERGLRMFFPVLAVKALAVLLMSAAVVIAAAPLLAAVFGFTELWVGILGTIALVAVSVPWLVTVYFVYEYALRFVVVDGLGAIDAMRSAGSFMHGRIEDSIRLLLADGIGRVVGFIAGGVSALLLAAIIGLPVFFAFGILPAAIAAGVIVAPVSVMLLGAIGTYRSSIWTLGYLQARSEA